MMSLLMCWQVIFNSFLRYLFFVMQAVMQEFLNYIGNLSSVPPQAIPACFDTIRKYYQDFTDPQTLGFAFYKISEIVIRSKALPQHTQQFFEQLVYDVIDRTIECQFRSGSEALRFILDSSMEYYKHNSLDPSLRHPLGLNRKLNYYQPEVGEEVDVVKPYVTSTSYCAWTRGTLVARDGKKYILKYANTDATATVTSQPLFDLLGSRTHDHDWRDSLQFGSLVDAFNRFWYQATVVQVGVDNGAKRVRISFRRFSETGKKVDSDGNRYDGLGPNEDQWIDIYSCRIQRPGKMARQFCEYSHTSEQIVVDDTYDLLFEKEYQAEPFYAIMRTSFSRSLSFLHFYQHFCKKRGNEVFLEVLKKRDIPIDTCINIMIILGNTACLIPRMGLQRYLPALLGEAIQYLKEQHKIFNPMRLDAISFFIQTSAKRLHSLSRKHMILNDIRRFLVLEYLKLNLQKQMIALRYIFELIKPARPYQNEAQCNELHNFLVDNQIFYRVIQNNAHQQILSRSGEIIRYMLDHGLAGWPQIQHIWNIVPHSDLRGRTTVQRLIGEISKDFSFEFTAKVIDKLLVVRETQLTVDKLQLLRVLKDRPLNMEYKVKILNYLWECLTVKATNIKQQVEEEAENVFRGFISTIKESTLKLEVLKAILRRLKEITIVRTEMYLFKEFILTYPLKNEPNQMQEEGAAPKTVADVVDFLKNEQIYEVLLRLLGCAKAKEKVESILEFIQFLFEKDKNDISLTVKAIYDILGPSDVFLLWARALTDRATSFFVQLYQHPANMQRFEKLTPQAFEAIKSILLDINVSVGNIKVLRKRKIVAVQQGPLLPHQNSISTSTEDYSVMKQDPKGKQQIITFVYVLKSPFECIGVSFLLQLCQFINGSAVYNDAIRLIIQFIVNLDDSIINKAVDFRKEFLTMMFNHIAQIVATKQLAASKIQLDIYINLMQELFAQTERQGLVDIRPHFATIEGEVLRLKIENIISGNELHKKEPLVVEVNENSTLWDLKLRLSEVYSEPVEKIDVVKYVNPIEDNNNGKALTDLHFFNEQGIKVARREPRDIPRHQLLSHDGNQLSQRMEQIVQKWFNSYEKEGLLSAESLARLSAQKWKGSIMKDQAKLEQVISKYDVEGRGGITLGHFKDFFWRKSVENNALVWRILNLAGYRNNLRHGEEPIPLPPTSARKILSTRAVYDTIFSLLSSQVFQPVHMGFYRLLVMLETDQELCQVVKKDVRDFLENQKCIYRLSYGLESLINELDSSLTLYSQFYSHKGHQEIANKLDFFFSDPQKSIYLFDTSLKTIVIPNLLKILNSYVYPIAATHRMVRFFKKVRINHMDMPDVIKKLALEDSYADPQEEKRQALLKCDPLNVEPLYNLALRILQNLTKNFNSEYLVRISHQIIRLYASLSFTHPGFKPQHILNCANSGSLNIRRSSHALVYLYLVEHPHEAFPLLQKLVQSIPTDVKYASNTYFQLLKCILEKSIELAPDNENSTSFLTNLALQLLQHLFKTPNEQRQTFSASRIIEGVLQNILVVVQKRPAVARLLRHFKQKLIQDCLFFYDVKGKLQRVEITPQMLLNTTQAEHFPNYVKCKSQSSRSQLMTLIHLLYKQSEPTEDFFRTFVLPILADLPENTRRTSGRFMHVGLNNLGSTCYLNSMLQVLNTIEPFRNALMHAPIDAPLVKQLQALFSYLFFSQRLDYVPKELLASFAPPINPSIQQDTTQFLNFLFDQLEPLLKESPYRHLLQQIFKGSQVAQMICHACGARRERVQTFFSYSVEIEGKYDLHAALDGMHGGQLISDCLCESCGARSDTTKRNVLKEVPNIFFIHLKRIVFNYDLFMNTKIHTRLFFPEELDFEPFTKEGLELRESLGVEYMKGLKDNEEEAKRFAELTLHGKNKEFYKLRLKGIIVHSGTPDVGHYYAILKRNNGWVKFDDSRVSSFPMSFFEDQCYGGTWVADEWGGSSSSKNAYVLIYEKDHKKDIEIQQTQEDGSVVKKLVPEKQLGTYNTVEWYKEVWLDNHSLMLEQHLTAENYTKEFLSFTCKMLQLAPSPTTIQIISQVFFKISALSGEVGNLLQIFNKNLHLVNADILDQYVLSDPKRTFGLLFHQQVKVRDFASSYIERVLMLCYQREDNSVKEKVVRFIQQYLNNLHGEVAKNWLRIDGYFKLFQKLVEGSLAFPELYGMFVGSDLIAYFIDFIMEKQSPLNIYQKKYSLGTKSNPVSFSCGLNVIFFLLKRTFGLIGTNYQVPALPFNELFHLSDNAVSCLSSMPFFEKMIKENQNSFAIASIIQRLSILNITFSHAIARVLLKVFNENTDASDDCETVMYCITRFLNIRDAFWTNRAEYVLGYGTCYIFEKNAMSCLEEEKFVYPSTLENVFPLEGLLSYIHINRNRVPLTVLNMIKTLLESTSCSEEAMDYLIQQPAPAYTHLRYIDWLRPYVNEVLNTLTTLTEKKKEQALGKVSICNLYLDDIQKRIQAKQTPMFVQVLGQVGDKVLTDSFTDPEKQIQVNLYRIPAFGVESLPNGRGNAVFDAHLTNGRLETQVAETSNILKFFKQATKPLAIKAKNVEEHEDKEIISLFDEQPNPKKEDPVVAVIPPKEEKMVEEVKSAPLETIEEIVPVDINIQNARELQDYLHLIEVINNTETNKLVTLNISGNTNANLPRQLRFIASKSKEEYHYQKTNPYQPLGKIHYNLAVSESNENIKPFFRLYGNAYAQPPPEPVVEEVKQDAKEKMEIEQQDLNDFIDNDNDQISCPICTFYNPPTNTHCEICGSAFN